MQCSGVVQYSTIWCNVVAWCSAVTMQCNAIQWHDAFDVLMLRVYTAATSRSAMACNAVTWCSAMQWCNAMMQCSVYVLMLHAYTAAASSNTMPCSAVAWCSAVTWCSAMPAVDSAGSQLRHKQCHQVSLAKRWYLILPSTSTSEMLIAYIELEHGIWNRKELRVKPLSGFVAGFHAIVARQRFSVSFRL